MCPPNLPNPNAASIPPQAFADSVEHAQRTFKLTLAYDGSGYCGWQRQTGHPSIQAVVEEAICKLTGHKNIITRASSRTDTGVHALGQVVAFTTDLWRASAIHLTFALNTFLPRDIVVRHTEEVPLAFHPIQDCVGKRYRYQIYASRIADPLRKRFHWWTPRLIDVQSMREAAQYLVGCHDFASFQTGGSPRKSTNRTVREIAIQSRKAMDGWDVDIEVEADGFLYNMVRNIAGTLVQVGHGRKSADWMADVLQARDRRAAGQTAPPEGLFLLKVFYPQDEPSLQGLVGQASS